MSVLRTQILSPTTIEAKLLRMAYQIYEQNPTDTEIVLVAVGESGYFLAQNLHQKIGHISPLSVSLIAVKIDRSSPLGKMSIAFQSPLPPQKNLILVDDVLYSGRTLLSLASECLNYSPISIQTLVLIDRGHRQMPITPNYVGIELATTLQQHVSVEIEGNQASAYLL
jgi:pyrimidine operon attenuation protein/uracil phosphoribosyltransferase